MLPIQFMPIKYNFNAGGNGVKYIVIHDTGNPTASAVNHYRYFNGGNRGASAHYFVDDSNIVQLIKDTDRAWHTGVSSKTSKCGAGNDNSIGIEICLPGDRNKTVAHTIDLTVHLMKKYNIPIERVVRHYDCSGKYCPNFMRHNNWAKWVEFKARVANQLGGNEMKEADIRNIVSAEISKVKVEMLKEVDDRIAKALRPSLVGEDRKHWGDAELEKYNARMISKGKAPLSDKRPADFITRAEVATMINREAD